jgi:hypothetical protein
MTNKTKTSAKGDHKSEKGLLSGWAVSNLRPKFDIAPDQNARKCQQTQSVKPPGAPRTQTDSCHSFTDGSNGDADSHEKWRGMDMSYTAHTSPQINQLKAQGSDGTVSNLIPKLLMNLQL